jgi:leader peptidase (prepilin peptidase) / N-methyltransferase
MSPAMPLDQFWPFLLFTFVVGASVGSFLNVCVARWPAELSVVSPPSRCPTCQHQIRWYENVPIFGWLRLGGKCAGCRGAISPQYPMIELLVALGWLATVWTLGPTFEALRIAVVGTILLGIALTDLQHYLIPDGFTLFGLFFVIATSVVGVLWFPEETTHFVGPIDAIIGACVGAGAIRIVGWLGEVALKKEAMGFGDETLMAFVGAAIGTNRALLTVVGGAFIGAIAFLCIVGPIVAVRARRRGEEFAFPDVPFGVFLAPAALLALLWGDSLIAWYLEHAIGQ